MTIDASPLSVAFIERNPSSAARVIESLSTDDATALLDLLPVHACTKALGRMTPFSAAQSLSLVNVDRASLILQAMMFLDATSILRVINDESRTAILEALPIDLVKDFKKSLSHPPESVGAWMNQRTSPLPHTYLVKDALKYARQKRRPEGDELFLTDDGGRLVGVIRISQLVQYDGKTVLGDLAKLDPPTVSNRSTLSSVLNLPHWDNHAIIAVTGRKGNFLGTLSRNLVLQGISQSRRQSTGSNPNTLLSHLANGCFVSFVGLISLVFASVNLQNQKANSESKNGK